MINHCRKQSNLSPKVVVADSCPHLVFVAARDIVSGEELLYDYGERRKDLVHHNPWLKH